MKKQFLTVCLAATFLSAGCGNEKGLKIGFEYDFSPPSIQCAVKSSSTEFDADDVTLDFYFSFMASYKLSDENYQFIGFAVYFCTALVLDITQYLQTFVDYRELEGHYLMKKIPADEYREEDYTITMKLFHDNKFKHSETFTVPKEILTDSVGDFYFKIIDIQYSQKDTGYCITDKGYLKMHYEYINEQIIRLSKL